MTDKPASAVRQQPTAAAHALQAGEPPEEHPLSAPPHLTPSERQQRRRVRYRMLAHALEELLRGQDTGEPE